jgi:hypothetical protein
MRRPVWIFFGPLPQSYRKARPTRRFVPFTRCPHTDIAHKVCIVSKSQIPSFPFSVLTFFTYIKRKGHIFFPLVKTDLPPSNSTKISEVTQQESLPGSSSRAASLISDGARR